MNFIQGSVCSFFFVNIPNDAEAISSNGFAFTVVYLFYHIFMRFWLLWTANI